MCGTALWPARNDKVVVTPPVVVQEPELAHVDSVADVEALPLTTRGVEANGVDDAVIAALTRLRDLEVLVVRESWNESFGLSLKMTPPEHPRHITNASWRHFGSFTKLRRLELSGTVLVAKFSNGDASAVVATLEKLPLLENLSLRCLDSYDVALAHLPSLRGLRRLDLSFNHGFSEEGVKSLAQCRSLRSLSLRGCQQLHGTWLARLGEMPELEELDLSLIDGMNWRNGTEEVNDPENEDLLKKAHWLADSLDAGVNLATLAGLAEAPRLRVLDVSSGHWTSDALAQLGACKTLVELNACGGRNADHGFVASLPRGLLRLEVCGDYTDAFCAAVRARLTSLRHVNVAACYQITDRGLADLLAMPSLRVLDMRQMRGLTVASVDALAKATQLEEIDLRHCDFVTAQHVLRLEHTLPHLRKLQTNIAPEELAAATALPEPIQVRTRQEIEALPGDTRNVVALDIEDDCMPALARLRRLERLEIPAIWTLPTQTQFPLRSITDAGLRHLAGLSSLRELHVHGQLEVHGEGLDVLAQLQALEELDLVLMKITDAGLAHLASLPRLRVLHLQHCQGFGRASLEVIAQLPALRELSLAGCGHVEDEWLALLGGMRRLERLDLSMIGSRAHFLFWPGHLSPPEPGSGVTDTVIEALGKVTSLHVLNLSNAGITGNGLRHLQGLPALEHLDLGSTSVTGTDLRWLPPGITSLALRGCADLGQDFGPVLAAATPRLHTLDLLGCPKLIDACLPSLRALTTLRSLDLSQCPEFTADAARDLTALSWLETLTLRDWKAFGDAEWKAVRAMPNLKRLDTDMGTEKPH